MALTPQEIATGVLNPDRTVADVQSIRAANLPFGVYESLLQQARRNEERMANNVTSSQIEAGYGQQARPDVSGLANREAPSYAAPKRQNVRPQRTGVVGGGRIRTSGKGSTGAPNAHAKTTTTPDGKGIITDGNLNEEMAKTDRQSVGYNIPDYVMEGENVPYEPDADKNSSALVPALVGLAAATAAGGAGAAANAYNELKSKAGEEIKATENYYKRAAKEAGLMSNKEYKADTINKATAIRNEMLERLRSNENLLQEYYVNRSVALSRGQTPETWEEFLERKQAIPTEQEISRMGSSRTSPKFIKNAPYDVVADAAPAAEVAPTAKAPAPSAATKFLNRALGLAALGLSGKGEYEALESVINKVFDGKNWEDYNSMNAAEEVADGVINPFTSMVGADDPARKTMALLRGLLGANNAEDYANMERWENERQARKELMANKGFWDYINPLNALDTANDLLIPAQDAVDYLVNDYNWGSNAAEKFWADTQKKR